MITICNQGVPDSYYVRRCNSRVGSPIKIEREICFFDMNGNIHTLSLPIYSVNISFDCVDSKVSIDRNFDPKEMYHHAVAVKKKGDDRYTLFIPSYQLTRYEVCTDIEENNNGVWMNKIATIKVGVSSFTPSVPMIGDIFYNPDEGIITFTCVVEEGFTDEYKKAMKLNETLTNEVGNGIQLMTDFALFKLMQKYRLTRKRLKTNK